MSPPRDARRGDAARAVLAGLAPALLLAPAARFLAHDVPGARGAALVTLLLETVFLLSASVAAGLDARRGVRGAAILLVVLVVAACGSCGAVVLGAHGPSVLTAQPASVATALLGFGLGRAARDASAKRGPASATAYASAAVLVASLLALSHAAPRLESHERLTEVLLAMNPVVAVAAGGGYDLIRCEALYNALSLSGYRFRYPAPWLAPALLGGAGLALTFLRIRSRRSALRPSMDAHPSQEALV